ncbi:hypothetical protein NKG05_14390 [Oerskovia sp. M15]
MSLYMAHGGTNFGLTAGPTTTGPACSPRSRATTRTPRWPRTAA